MRKVAELNLQYLKESTCDTRKNVFNYTAKAVFFKSCIVYLSNRFGLFLCFQRIAFRETCFFLASNIQHLSIACTALWAGIYPNIFSNVYVCFWTKIEFSIVVNCRWEVWRYFKLHKGFMTGSWQGFRRFKAPENFWPFYIWRTNK